LPEWIRFLPLFVIGVFCSNFLARLDFLANDVLAKSEFFTVVHALAPRHISLLMTDQGVSGVRIIQPLSPISCRALCVESEDFGTVQGMLLDFDLSGRFL